jgi:pimeloyl-ACP methyl ester carboxylesterase
MRKMETFEAVSSSTQGHRRTPRRLPSRTLCKSARRPGRRPLGVPDLRPKPSVLAKMVLDTVRAMSTFFRDVVGMPGWSSWLSAVPLAAVPAYRARTPGQVADLTAIDALADRRPQYRTIQNPVLGIWATSSPAHLAHRMKALIEVLPNAESWEVDGGHASQQQHPQLHAERIRAFLNRR